MLNFFLFPYENMQSLEVPHWGAYNEYMYLCFNEYFPDTLLSGAVLTYQLIQSAYMYQYKC